MGNTKKPTPKNRPVYPIYIYDENTLEEEADGTQISDIKPIASELMNLSTNSATPLTPLKLDDDGEGVTLQNSTGVAALVISYQPAARQSPFGDKRPTIPKPRMLVCVPNLNLLDNKILQSFYANNLGKLKVKCNLADVENIYQIFRKLFKEGKMDFEYKDELASREEEIKKIIADYENYLDHAENAPPPKLPF